MSFQSKTYYLQGGKEIKAKEGRQVLQNGILEEYFNSGKSFFVIGKSFHRFFIFLHCVLLEVSKPEQLKVC